LLAILAGLDDGSSGEVNLVGQPLHALDEEARAALRARHIGFVFQSFMLIPTLNALENVELPGLLRGRISARAANMPEHCWNSWDWVTASITFRRSFPGRATARCTGSRL
jgi:predicted ABC-type transport system involved in lysophospholipase L1 biosynthesis ATPase subunit